MPKRSQLADGLSWLLVFLSPIWAAASFHAGNWALGLVCLAMLLVQVERLLARHGVDWGVPLLARRPRLSRVQFALAQIGFVVGGAVLAFFLVGFPWFLLLVAPIVIIEVISLTSKSGHANGPGRE